MPKKAEVIFRQNVKQRDTRLSSFHTIYTKVGNYDPTISIDGDSSLLTKLFLHVSYCPKKQPKHDSNLV